jgi:hypothetical protein
MENSFLQLQNKYEAKFEGFGSIETAIQQRMETTNVFSMMAELYIPMAAGAAVKISTGADVKSGASMPDFDWRYRVPQAAIQQISDPRARFQPYLPF